jgi:hypothetical protein
MAIVSREEEAIGHDAGQSEAKGRALADKK